MSEREDDMTGNPKDGGAACAWCERPAHIRQGRIMLCAVHYRISSMRARAKRDGKIVPSRAEIEALVPTPFVCFGCDRAMNWLRSDGASTQVTLQHDRSGHLRLICLGCNTRHALHPGDTYYEIPAGHKRCFDCEQVKPFEEFPVARSRPIGRYSYCRPCTSIRFKKWSNQHAMA